MTVKELVRGKCVWPTPGEFPENSSAHDHGNRTSRRVRVSITHLPGLSVTSMIRTLWSFPWPPLFPSHLWTEGLSIWEMKDVIFWIKREELINLGMRPFNFESRRYFVTSSDLGTLCNLRGSHGLCHYFSSSDRNIWMGDIHKAMLLLFPTQCVVQCIRHTLLRVPYISAFQ